jgi:hypothetical protein
MEEDVGEYPRTIIIFTTLQENLGMWPFCTEFIPRIVTVEQQEDRLNSCTNLLNKLKRTKP